MIKKTKPNNFNTTTLILLIIFSFGNFSHAQTWDEIIKLTAIDTDSDDHFGYSVAIDGTTAVVGAYSEDNEGTLSGATYVFELIDDVWIETAKLTPSDADNGDTFGHSVSIDGYKVIIGAAWDDEAETNAGAAYIFELIDDAWVEVTKLTASDADNGDIFGSTVSIYDDKVVIGSIFDSDDGYRSGSAYLFELIDDVWIETAKLTASDADLEDHFGNSVSIYENTVIVGADHDDNDGIYSGSAYVFELVDGVWTEIVKLIALDADAGDSFGQSVSINGNRIVVGASSDGDIAFYSGASYVYELIDGVWTEIIKLKASDADLGDHFGLSVSIKADRIIIGAYNDSEEDIQAGASYIFELIDGVWEETAKLTASDGSENDNLGISVSIDNDYAFVGAYRNAEEGFHAGAVYVYEFDCPITLIPTVTESEICLGDSVVFAGEGAFSYIWNLDVIDGEFFIPYTTGVITYTVTGITEDGCEKTDSISIEIHELPDVNIIISEDSICYGDSVIFFVEGATDYTWIPETIIDGEPYFPVETGLETYTVTGTDDNGCSSIDSIEVVMLEMIEITSIVNDEMFGEDGSIDISVTGGLSPYTFDWDIDGTGDYDDDQNLTDLGGGAYLVFILDEAGCEISEVIVLESELSMDEQEGILVTLYPNPTPAYIVVESQGHLNYEVISISGVQLLDGSGIEKVKVNLEDLVAGIYLMKITSNDGSKLLRFIKN